MTRLDDVKTKLENDVVKPFLSTINDKLAHFADPQYTIATYAPPAGTPYSEFITSLGLPVHGHTPSLLLHRLGESQTLVDRASEVICFASGNEQHKWLVNTPGSGKTRLAFEGLNQLWGIFLTAVRDQSGLGSTDLFALVQFHLDDVVRNPPLDDTATFDKNRDIVKERFAALLLARAYIMREFLELAAKLSPNGALNERHKRSWLLLQLLPIFDVPLPSTSIPREQRRILKSDIFEALTVRLIQQEVTGLYLIPILREILQDVISSIAIAFPQERILFVLDESQGLVKALPKSFLSVSALGETRPILREIVANLSAFISSWHEDTVILGLGTGLSERSIQEAVATVSGKQTPFETHSELGAFDTPAAVRAYMQDYVPREVLETPSGHMLQRRCWELLRGRHRFLANFLVELIRANYQAPQTVFNEYVKMLTAARLTDADEYIQHEDTDALRSTFKMSNLYPILNPNKWVPSLLNTFALAVATYLMRGEIRIVEGDDEHRMINLGIARYSRAGDISRSNIARIDEPLVLLAGTVFFHPGLAAPGATSTLQVLGSRMAAHSGPQNWNGFEDFLIFISWFIIFCEPRRIGDFLDIRGGPPGLADENVVMAMLRKNAIGGVTVHTSDKAGPRPDIVKVCSNGETSYKATKDRFYYTAFSTLGVDKSVPSYDGSKPTQCFDQWLLHEANAPVCFLSTCYGPDAALHWKIVGGKNDGKLFTGFLQMKYRRYGLNDEGARRAIMSVTPSHLGDARLHARRPGKKASTKAEIELLRQHLKDTYKTVKNGTPASSLCGPYRVVRVVASTLDLNFQRVDRATSTLKFRKELDDRHPFATLNTHFVDRILKKETPSYQITNMKARLNIDGADEEDKPDDVEIPVVASTSCATDERVPENGDGDKRADIEDTEEQLDDAEDAGADNEDTEDASEMPSALGAGDGQVTTTMTTRGGSKRSKHGAAEERAPNRPRRDAVAAQASPPEGQRIVTRSVSRMRQAATSNGTRRSARLATKGNATAGPSTSQASGTGPAKKQTTTTGKQSKSRR